MAIETNRVNYQTETEQRIPKSSIRNEPEHEHHETYETAHKMAAGGIGLAALLGLSSVVLSILGLVHVAPYYMAGISSVALGAALLLAGGFSKEWFTAPREHFFYEGEGAMSTDVMAGVGGVVLGILALLGVVPNILLPVAVLAFGVSLFMSSWIASGHFSGIKCLTGLSGIVLGIIALTSLVPISLTLVGFLTMGFGILFSGSLQSGKYMYAASAA